MATTKVSNSAASSNPDISVATVTQGGAVFQEVVSGIANQPHDEIQLGYTSGTLTSVVYKLAGVTVATLTLGYTGGNLTSVVRS
jgi:hypothetical protein